MNMRMFFFLLLPLSSWASTPLQIKQSKTVHYTPAQVYHVIHDVASYSQFLPWCKASGFRELDPIHGEGWLELKIGWLPPLRFSTLNTAKEDESISMELLNGPLKSLCGQWTINSNHPQETKVDLWVQVEFQPPFLAQVFEYMTGYATKIVIEAFEKRLLYLYGSLNSDTMSDPSFLKPQ